MIGSATPLKLVPPALQISRVPSLAEQAADIIVTGISSGALKPGQRLYETELAATLKMSRVPLRGFAQDPGGAGHR